MVVFCIAVQKVSSTHSFSCLALGKYDPLSLPCYGCSCGVVQVWRSVLYGSKTASRGPAAALRPYDGRVWPAAGQISAGPRSEGFCVTNYGLCLCSKVRRVSFAPGRRCMRPWQKVELELVKDAFFCFACGRVWMMMFSKMKAALLCLPRQTDLVVFSCDRSLQPKPWSVQDLERALDWSSWIYAGRAAEACWWNGFVAKGWLQSVDAGGPGICWRESTEKIWPYRGGHRRSCPS